MEDNAKVAGERLLSLAIAKSDITIVVMDLLVSDYMSLRRSGMEK
jgi:hypothetical protein